PAVAARDRRLAPVCGNPVPRMRRRSPLTLIKTRKLTALVVMAVMAMATITYAQFGGQFGGQGRGGGRRGGGRRGGFGGGYQAAPRRPGPGSFTGDFTLRRLAYNQAPDG